MAEQPVSAPVNLTLTSSVTAIRAGSFAGPYQIINRNLQATVWASDNSSVSDGHGIPIEAGTSITWTKSGNLFLILGTDTLTAQVGQAEVTISYTSADYNPSPAAVAVAILNSGQLAVNTNVLIAENVAAFGFPGLMYDVSQYRSVYITLVPVGVATPDFLHVNWYQSEDDFISANDVGEDIISFWNGGSRLVAQKYQIPVRARFISLWTLNNTITLGSVVGSTSPSPWPTIYNVGLLAAVTGSSIANSQQSLAIGNANLAVGAQFELISQPWWGEIILSGFAATAATTADMSIVAPNSIAPMSWVLAPAVAGVSETVSGANRRTVRFALYGTEGRFLIANRAGAVADCRLWATPVANSN